MEDVVVPHTLVTPEELEKAMKDFPPKWEAGQFTDGTPNTPADRITRPFTLRRLSNGIRVGIAQNTAESQVSCDTRKGLSFLFTILISFLIPAFHGVILVNKAWTPPPRSPRWTRCREKTWI